MLLCHFTRTFWTAHRFPRLGIQEDEHEAVGELLVKDSLEKNDRI